MFDLDRCLYNFQNVKKNNLHDRYKQSLTTLRKERDEILHDHKNCNVDEKRLIIRAYLNSKRQIKNCYSEHLNLLDKLIEPAKQVKFFSNYFYFKKHKIVTIFFFFFQKKKCIRGLSKRCYRHHCIDEYREIVINLRCDDTSIESSMAHCIQAVTRLEFVDQLSPYDACISSIPEYQRWYSCISFL